MQLKFGIEIEFFGIRRADISDKLMEAGINAPAERYNHVTKEHWKLVGDGSVSREGNELVSPILYGDEGLVELEKILKILNKNNAKIDESCGIHIHHDVRDFELDNFKSLYNFMYQHMDIIDAYMNKNRRKATGSGYCNPLSNIEIQQVNNCLDISEILKTLNRRYKTLNIQSYREYGTIDFRQHEGSLDSEKISNWIELTYRILQYVKNNKVEMKLEQDTLENQLINLRKTLNLYGTNLSKFYSKILQKHEIQVA